MDLQTTAISQLSGDYKRILLKQLLETQNRAVPSGTCAKPAEPGRYPLSAGQKGLWMVHQLAAQNCAYNTPLALRIVGPLDPDVLRLALERLVQRHPALRTRIATHDGEMVNEVAPAGDLYFKSEDIAGLNEAQTAAHLKKIIRKPFDLQTGPLMRVYLFSKSNAEQILLFNFHHIIFDGGSVSPLLNDLIWLYDTALADALDSLPLIETTYADFVAWQAKMLTGEKGITHKNYWQRQLQGAPAILEMPTDRSRPPIPAPKGAVHSAAFPPDLSARLKALAKAADVSLFALFLSLFNVLLYRYTCQEDILVGTALETRPGTRFEALIGYFVNMVVIRSVLSGDISFKELLKQVQATAFEALEHGDYPFSEIVRELAPDYDRSRSPLFQTAFAYQNWAMDMDALGLARPATSGLSFEPMLEIHQEGEFDLTLEVVETAAGHHVFFKYNPDLFDEATISRMAGHFRTLARSVIADAGKALSQLQLLTDAEQHQILKVCNDTRADFPRDKCIHQLFEAQVEKAPDAVAVVCGDHRLTYGELNARANQLARCLKSLGVGPDVLVGICVERSLEMIVGLMGILKAGGAYLPIDPVYPEERIAFMLSDSQAPILLSQDKLVETLPCHQSRLLRLDRDWDLISVESEANPTSDSSNGDLAYCIYTSGSTGRPKGVLIPHCGLLNLVFWHQSAFGVTATDRATQLAGTAFDAAVWEIWPYLTAGATLYLPGTDILAMPEHLKNWLVSEQISISFLPTPLAEELLALSWPEKTALRIMLTGGDKLSGYPAADLPFQLVNNYGPTENTVVTTSGLVTSGNRSDTAPHIGAPIANTQVYILDKHLQQTPIGIPGEIHIGGEGLARAYLNREELTAEKFIPHPFDNAPGRRLYKTGDWACFLADGNIKFLGRIDNQVKIRGFRIELGEIETTLVQHHEVLQAVVMLREDRPGEKQLAAYVVAEPDRKPSAGALKQFLKETLPAYMVPAAIMLLETFPLTPNGKVDRRALPKPDPVQCLSAEHDAAPRTDTEKELTAVWREILSMASIGIHDNFFDVGGHSLLAIRLIQRIETALGASMPVSTLFKAPTIAEMARLIDSQKTADTFSPLVGIRPKKEKTPLFCVHPGDGNVFHFTELARLLGDGQPFYGLQAYGLEPGTEPLSDIREMAANYIEAIRNVQPHGPYFIGGLCGGGTIAFEMAQQLKQSGETVPRLVLLDSLAPHMYNPIDETRFFIGFARDFDGLADANLLPLFQQQRNIDPAEGVAGVRKNLEGLNTTERLRTLWTCARKAGILKSDVSMEYLSRVFNVYSGIYSGLLNYHAQPYDGPIVFFRALGEMIDPQAEQSDTMCRWIEDSRSLELVRMFRETPFLGWDQYAALPIQMVDVPGNHFTMLAQPHVNTLKSLLEKCLKG